MSENKWDKGGQTGVSQDNSFKYSYPQASGYNSRHNSGFKNQSENQTITKLLIFGSKAGVEATSAASQYSCFPSFRQSPPQPLRMGISCDLFVPEM